jgi:hypothetical protein
LIEGMSFLLKLISKITMINLMVGPLNLVTRHDIKKTFFFSYNVNCLFMQFKQRQIYFI